MTFVYGLHDGVKEDALSPQCWHERLVEAGPDATVVVGDDGTIVLVNGQTEAVFGYSREDLVGRPVELLVPGPLTEQTLSAVRADGTRVLLDIAVSSISTAAGTMDMVTIRDATARVDGERRLEAQDYWRAGLDSMLDGFSVLRAVRVDGAIVDFEWVYINATGAANYRRVPGQLVGARMTAVLPGVMASGRFAELCRIVETGEPRHWMRADDIEAGVEGVFDWRSWKVDDGYASSWRNVTEVQQTGDNLRASEERIRETNTDLRTQSRAIALISRGTDALQRCATLDEALEIVGRATPLVFGEATIGALYGTMAGGRAFSSISAWGGLDASQPVETDQCWALRAGVTHMFGEDPLALRCHHAVPGAQWTACIPLIAQGETLALIHIEQSGLASSSSDRELVTLLGTQWGLTLANLRLRESLQELSVRDPLTALFNRRYLDEALEQAVHRASRSGEPLCVVMVDIDHFKSFNDTHGHDGGDVVLRDFGRYLLESTRGEDIVARYGGEEFVLVMAQMGDADGASRLDDLLAGWRQRGDCERIAAHLRPYPTVSAGGSYYRTGQTKGELLAIADGALYRAKAAGRDRCVMDIG